MDDLPLTQRQTIDLAFFGGLTQAEIATLLGLPLDTVKTGMREGMERLRRTLRPLVDEATTKVPEDLAAYALDALDPEARRRVEMSLRDTDDPRLTRLLREYCAVVDLLPHTVVSQPVPGTAWAGILARIRSASGAPSNPRAPEAGG